MNAIEVTGLVKSYGKVPAVDDFSFTVGRQELVALAGPDGAGKTSLFRAICGLVDVDRGEISLLGRDIGKDFESIKPSLGYMPQAFSLYPDLSVEENLRFYKGATVVTPNRKEAEIASGIKIKAVDSLRKAGMRLLQRFNSKAVLITLGEDGMALFQKGKKWMHIPTVAQEVYDVSGAGDTVIGTFALAKASGANMMEAAHLSNIAAGVVVGKLGIAICTPDELKSHLRQIKKYGIRQRDSLPSESIFK